jgi:hypothetical protein
MIAEEFTNNLKMQILHDTKEHIKQDLEPKIKELNCEQCNQQTYAIENFSDDEKFITAHVKCTNCGFDGKVVVHLLQDELDKGLDEVRGGIESLENTIADCNRKLNFH